MNLWWGENATKLRVFENGERIATVALAYGGTGAQSAEIPHEQGPRRHRAQIAPVTRR